MSGDFCGGGGGLSQSTYTVSVSLIQKKNAEKRGGRKVLKHKVTLFSCSQIFITNHLGKGVGGGGLIKMSRTVRDGLVREGGLKGGGGGGLITTILYDFGHFPFDLFVSIFYKHAFNRFVLCLG